MMRIGIVGGGPECKELLLLLSEYSNYSNYSIAAVIDPKKDAPGRVLAEELGIPTFDDYEALKSIEGLQVVVDLSGDVETQKGLLDLIPEGVDLVGKRVVELFMAIMEELHDRITLQRQLTASDSVIAVSKVVYQLTHVIRNALMSTGALTRKLLLDESTPYVTKKTLKKVLKHVEQMEKAVRQACEIALVSTPKLRETDIVPLLQEWCHSFCAEARRYDMEARCHVEEGLPKVMLDRDLFSQVLWHIAEYTLQAIYRTSKTIIFEARLCWDEIIMVFREGGDTEICKTESDGGATVPVIPSRRSHIWLDLCTKIMFEHGGDVRMERKDGKLLSIITVPVRPPRPQVGSDQSRERGAATTRPPL